LKDQIHRIRAIHEILLAFSTTARIITVELSRGGRESASKSIV
jgi:hypothetical protein